MVNIACCGQKHKRKLPYRRRQNGPGPADIDLHRDDIEPRPPRVNFLKQTPCIQMLLQWLRNVQLNAVCIFRRFPTFNFCMPC